MLQGMRNVWRKRSLKTNSVTRGGKPPLFFVFRYHIFPIKKFFYFFLYILHKITSLNIFSIWQNVSKRDGEKMDIFIFFSQKSNILRVFYRVFNIKWYF